MNCPVEMTSYGMIRIPSFVKIGTGIKAVLRFGLRNFGGCNIGITNVRNF
jgi:hypothetical protein